MAEPTLEFLGEQIAGIQSELRGLRGVRSDVAHLRAEINDQADATRQRIDNLEISLNNRIGSVYGRIDHMDNRIDGLSQRIDNLSEHVGNLERSFDAQFSQVHATMTTNLQVVLAAIDAKP